GAVSGTISLSDTRRPEVLEFIQRVVIAANTAGKPVGICGEAASDSESARLFVSLGVDSLSASSALLPQLRASLLTRE
ncbi:MAG: putative PEP-binding protein, partial [Rhodoluna sp.]